MKSILHAWVTELGLRHQGTLLAGIRGCDGVQKHDPSKPVMRAIRWAVLVPHDERELVEPKGFMHYNYTTFPDDVEALAKNMDEYPSHFIWHLIHAVEVIGYKYPTDLVRSQFHQAYCRLVSKFHVSPETPWQMDERLTEDRLENGTVAG